MEYFTDLDTDSDEAEFLGSEGEVTKCADKPPQCPAKKQTSMLKAPKRYTKTLTSEAKHKNSEQSTAKTVTENGKQQDVRWTDSSLPDAGCLKVGDRVKISGVKTGMLMFFGQTHFAEGDWCGIELDDPEGKHDGLVKGTRYFKCKEKHGIFVPVHKVEVFTEDLYMYDSEAAYAPSDISSGDERSPSPPDRTYCASESQMIDLMKPQHPSDQDQDQLDSDLTSKARLLQKTFQMKDIDSTDSTSSSRDSSASRGSLFGRRKPSDRHTHSKAEKRSATRIAKDGASRLDATFQVTSSPHEKKTKMSHAEDNKDLNTKFSLDDSGEDLLDVYNSSRVDNHTAHTLAYGLESVGSDVEASRQLDATFELKKATTLEQTTGLVKQPSLEWDPEDENMSVESSMGIITDLDKSTFTDEWKKILSNQSSGLTAKQRHNIPEIMETELDKEIAGMATPEIDVSGSTVSGKEDGSSPEPEHRSAIKNFSLPLAEVCDSKAQSAQKSAGEKLATPSTEVVTKDYDEQLQSDVHTEAKNASSGSTDNEKSDLNLEGHTLDASFVLTKTAVEQYASLVKGAEEERSLQDEKVSSLQRDDVTISWGTRLKDFSDVPNLEEVTMPEGLLMSLTDDNSPDDIYVDVGDPPQTQQTSSTNTSGEHEVKFDQNSNGITTTKQENIFDIDKDHNISEPEGIRCATNKEVDSSLDDTHAWQSDMDHVTDAEQLMADLKASRLQCRPASMVSSSSADTGIALDDKDVLRERPISMVSTSSADTGYQAEQDGEGVSIATSYPLTESSDVLMETDVNMDTLVLPENADAPTDDRIDVLENKPDYRDDLLASDRDQASSPEGATVDSEHGEISGTESQQELAQKTDDETTVQEAVSPENAVELEQMLLESDNTVTGQQMNDVLPHLKDNRPDITMVSVESEAMDTEMVESATMKDVMEKCVAIEHDQLVHNIQVEAHIEMREPFLEEPRDLDKHDEHENDVNMDKEEDEETNEMAVDGDSHIDVRSSPDAKLDQEDTPCESINVSSPRSREVASKTLTERKQARQVNERTKRPASGGLKRPGSSYTGRKRKDDNSVDRSVLQTKSLRHPAQVNASMKTETKSAVAKLDTHKVLPKSSKSDNLKADSEKRIPPSKISKDVSNKKKSERNPSKIGLDKKGKQPENLPDKDKEKRLAQARKDLNMLQSVPSEYIAPHLKTIEAHPVLDAGDGERKKSGIGSSSRSSLGQRKMATVRSKIDSGLKSASKLDSKPAKASTSQVNPTTKPGLSSRSSLRQPVAGMKRTSVTASSGSRLSRLPLSNPRPVRMSRPVSGSQQSLVSDHSGRESQGGAAGDHTSSSRKPSSSSLRPSLSSAGSESPMLDQVLDVSVSMGISQGQQSATASAGTRMTSSRRLLVRRTIREPSKSLASVTSSQTSTSESPKYRLPQATSTPKSTHSVDNSKSQKGGTTSTSVPSMKRPRQPDVVNNTLKKTNSLDEITRLEALCESRTKELNKVKILLRKRTTGFEAMIAIVKYLTDELNAFSCPMITAQLAEAQEQVKKSVLQLEELTKQRDAVIDEIQSIKQQHAEETESLIAKHQQALLALTDKLVKEKEDAVNEVIEKHSHEVNALKSYQERTMREIEEKHEKSIAEKKKQYEEELTRLKREHEKQINDLHCDHESKLNEITMRFETIKLNLLDKVEKLRIEGEELRQREAAMTEKCQRESDYKIQCALAHYKKEVESLNTVLELRASECHQLRKQVLEMQKELEKLPVAQEKIKSQEQQIENLQAIIDLRADNERSLTQKHNVLLRKYDKETKVTKRLSLDREELMWRLQEYDASGGVRRSISHSPTGSETSTPETIRRHRSPLPHSPHSPCDPKRSPLQKVPPQGSLKRTGTYEVLPQEYDDMNNLKQSDL